jgi:hypothetical protein
MLLCNNCCRGKVIIITYSECVSVAFWSLYRLSYRGFSSLRFFIFCNLLCVLREHKIFNEFSWGLYEAESWITKILPYNEKQLDSLFILSVDRPTDSQLKSTTSTNCCIYTVYLLMMGLQICPKHAEVDWRNKLKINSASSWFLLHRCVEMQVNKTWNLLKFTLYSVFK